MRKLPVICVLIGLLCSCSDDSPNVFVVDILDPMEGAAAIEMVQFPAGAFMMGSNLRPAWVIYIDPVTLRPDTTFNFERPVHAVTVDGFKIGKTEITQEQFKSVMGNNPSRFGGFYSLPVENVSWEEAVTFCNKLSEMAGLEICYDLESWECDFSKNGFRLPTEAEWEYACRAGTRTEYYFTGNLPPSALVFFMIIIEKGHGRVDIVYAENPVLPDENFLMLDMWYLTDSTFTTHTVGSKAPNPAGLYDMTGNVWEWCNDFFRIYNCNSQINPAGSKLGFTRARRGGSWASSALDCRSATRIGSHPGRGMSTTGFRIVRR